MVEKKDKGVRLTVQDMKLGGLIAREIPGGSNMTDCPTVEMLSEFIDGKTSPENRERIVAHVGDCAVCYSVVSDSLSIREEMINRSHARLKKTLAYSVPAVLAAAAVLLVVFRMVPPAHEFTGMPEHATARREAPIDQQTAPKSDIALSARSFAGTLADRLAGKNDASSFVRTAGKQPKPATTYGFSSSVSLEKSAFGIGMYLTDLELSLKAKDQEKIEVFAKKLIELLKPVESSYGILPSITRQRDTGVNSGGEPSRYEGLSGAVEALFENKKEAVFLKFGSWVEAASLAAEARDASFFHSAVVRGFTTELEQSGVPVGVLKNLSKLELLISSSSIQNDQFKAIARLFADIKEMF